MVDIVEPIAKILLIDDEPDILRIVERGLQPAGFQVMPFRYPSEALIHFRQHPNDYCVVLSDVRMPGTTGFQVAREVKSINPDIKVILMTAFDINSIEFEKVMPNTHIDGFIKKPATLETIKNTLMKHIGQTKNPNNIDSHYRSEEG